MYKDEFERLQTHSEVFKALAHPTRLFIVEKLLEQQYCVKELTEMIGVEMPTISKHLSVLQNAGIISSRKEANKIFYRIKRLCVKDTLSCVAGLKD